MATTIESVRRLNGNQLRVAVYKLVAGAADGYVEVQPELPDVLAFSALKTVGTIGSTGGKFTEATGTLRVECTYGNADELKVAVFSA